MKVSLSWLSELLDLSRLGKAPAEQAEKLAELLTQRGLEVEAIQRLDQGFEQVITAKLLKRDPHPQADRLSLCQVSTGKGETLEIVCGAQNMKAGDVVALAQVGAELPNGMKIAQSKIRGVVSNGMLCSEEELGLKESSEGILIFPSETPIGKPLAQILGRNDVVLELKLTANRGDCLSHYGLAREIAAGLGLSFDRITKLETNFTPLAKSGSRTPIQIQIEAGEGAPQFFGATIEGIKIKPSPEWVQKRLEALGSRSINAVVDATNLVMFELGHPVHAYDQTKLKDNIIGVRLAIKGETLPLLDGSSVKLLGDELVIFTGDHHQAVGLAGVMGGGNSEVSDDTQVLFLECAEFAPGLVRLASSRHQKKTEASHRFERGIDPARLEFVMRRLIWWIQTLAGGKVVAVHGKWKKWEPETISVPAGYLGRFLGMSVTDTEASKVLKGLGCKVVSSKTKLSVTPPSYRRDLKLKEDLAEEIARSLGYDQIPETLPPITTPPLHTGPLYDRLELMDRAKLSLTRAGFSESMHFAFTSQAWLEKCEMKGAAQVLNPISEECEWLVPSLLPGLLEATLYNQSHHFGSEPLALRLFQLRTTFELAPQTELKATSRLDTGMTEPWRLAWVLSGPRYEEALRAERGESDFSDLKGFSLSFLQSLGVKGARVRSLETDLNLVKASRLGNTLPLFHPGQTAVVIVGGKQIAGIFGTLHPAIAQKLKIRSTLYLAEWDWETLQSFSRPQSKPVVFKSWPNFPGIERDFALLVSDEVSVEKLTQSAMKAGQPLAKSAKIFDIYRGAQVAQGMTSVALRVIFYEENRSLQEAEVEQTVQKILEHWKKDLGVELRA